MTAKTDTMSQEIEITFKCSQNIATLMMAFYAIIANENPEDSIIGPDYFGWIVDELGEKAVEYEYYLKNSSGGEVLGGFSALVKAYSTKQ